MKSLEKEIEKVELVSEQVSDVFIKYKCSPQEVLSVHITEIAYLSHHLNIHTEELLSTIKDGLEMYSTYSKNNKGLNS